MKNRIKNYLSLTKKEWNGMVVMLVLIALVLAVPYVLQWLHKDSTINQSEFNAAVAQLNKANPGYKAGAGAKPGQELPAARDDQHGEVQRLSNGCACR